MVNKKLELTSLDKETLANINQLAADPVDAMHLASDVYTSAIYRYQRATAVAAGLPPPATWKPLSKFVRSFSEEIKARLSTMSKLFTTEEMIRIKKISGAIIRDLETDESDIGQCLVLLFAMEPEVAVLWVRAHLDELEARAAS